MKHVSAESDSGLWDPDSFLGMALDRHVQPCVRTHAVYRKVLVSAQAGGTPRWYTKSCF